MKLMPYGMHSIGSDDIREVVSVLRSEWITQGPKIREFEKRLCKYTGARYAVAVSSGTAALHLACMAAGLHKGDEAIVPAISFAATANSVIYCGARPVFCDVGKDTINIDTDDILKKITGKTRVIMPVDFAGHPADLKIIKSIARHKGLMVIEDAAHALGAEYKGGKVGCGKYSDMTIFSFHPIKSITTGEGGAILTNKRVLYERLKACRNHGITRDRKKFSTKVARNFFYGGWHYEMQDLAYNYRITDIQCALGISQLKKLNNFIDRRRRIAKAYARAFSDIDNIELPVEKGYVKSAWHIYVIRLKGAGAVGIKRRKAYDFLMKKGVGTQVHYMPIYRHPYYRKLGYRAGACRKAEDFYKRTLTIPLHHNMSRLDIDFVIKNIKAAIKKIY